MCISSLLYTFFIADVVLVGNLKPNFYNDDLRSDVQAKFIRSETLINLACLLL